KYKTLNYIYNSITKVGRRKGHRPLLSKWAERAPVGSTEASASLLARVGVVGPKRVADPSRLTWLTTGRPRCRTMSSVAHFFSRGCAVACFGSFVFHAAALAS